MKRFAVLLGLGLVLSVALGCVIPWPNSVYAPIMVTKSACMTGDSQVGQSKVGRAQAEGIILVAFGDASIKEACDDAKITRIHHVDSEELNVLCIYCRKVTVVYGE